MHLDLLGMYRLVDHLRIRCIHDQVYKVLMLMTATVFGGSYST